MTAITGIDVSKWQSRIDWKAVAEGSDHRFAVCKATEGVGYVDPRFRQNWEGIKEAGLLRGAYHFARVSRSSTLTQDAEAEAKHFSHTVGDLGEGDFGLALDIEWDKRVAKGIKAPDIVRWCKTFLDVCSIHSGRLPIIYTGPSYWRYKLGRSLELANYPLWSANYRKRLRQIPGWEALIWQHTGKGKCSGIKGRVDLNRFLGSEEDLRKLAGYMDVDEETSRREEALAVNAAGRLESPALDPFVRWLMELFQGLSRRSEREVT